jgi:DNA repair protein RecO (recombination protein O)
VLTSTQFGEGHKMVKLYTEELGRTEATAFGARKTKSRFGSRLEPFTTGIFLLYHKDEHSPYSIQDVEVTSQNNAIREDLNRFLIGNAVVEPVVRFVERMHRDKELFEILSSTLELLSIIGITKGLYLLSVYDLNFLSIMGYKPDWDNCVKCSNPMQNGETFSDAAAGFPLCSRCHTSSSIAVSPGAMRFVEWALQTPLHYAEKVRMEGETLNQIRQIIEHLFLCTFQRIPDSWHQMKNILDYSRYASEG